MSSSSNPSIDADEGEGNVLASDDEGGGSGVAGVGSGRVDAKRSASVWGNARCAAGSTWVTAKTE